ncbi:MAG: putative quinol monooxygenase [Chitinophagaceae bacterium]
MKTLQPIHVFAIWKVKEGQVETVLQLLKTVSAESIKEEGNLFYKVHQSNADANTIVLFEGYKDESAITAHRSSAHYTELVTGKIIGLLETREVILTTPLEV